MSYLDRNVSGHAAQHFIHCPPSEQPNNPEPPAPQDASTEGTDSAFEHTQQSFPDSPVFSSTRQSHLPTPQSPNTIGQYALGQYILDSPIAHSHSQAAYGVMSSQTSAPRTPYKTLEDFQLNSPPNVHQILTPESSPLFLRGKSPPRTNSAPQFGPFPFAEETPRASSSSIIMNMETFRRPSPPISGSTSEPITRSPLSSPFMAKLSLSDVEKAEKSPVSQTHPAQGPIQVEDVFYSEANPVISTPPLSPRTTHHSGGELEHVRLHMLDNRIAHLQERENRRPDYLKRSKRSSSDSGLHTDEERDPLPGIEIAVSPHKGRRLKLFQETSEESFEESLMAGGYGRYRTNDWLEQPQPTSSNAGSSNIISLLEAEHSSSPKELKKRKRLSAFQERPNATGSAARLAPVKMGNKGRVLLDISAEASEGVKQLSPTKKRANRRRSSAIRTPSSAEKIPDGEQVMPDRPNWPDSEFPWRVRLEERAEMAKAEEAERLRWIENFLDRDTDEDEEMDGDDAPPTLPGGVPKMKPGRGKMVPLSADPATSKSSSRSRRTFHPSDPADARAALMSRRTVRELTYRKQQREARRSAESDDNDEEVVCICNGRDDGRELVQCDYCQIWYHLQCIGIKNIAELGREEDPWYCDQCSRIGLARTPSPRNTPSLEPTFVETNDEPTSSLPFDLPFFQSSLQDSPAGPWNPQTFSVSSAHANQFGSLFSTESGWNDPKYGPSTPQVLTHGSRLHATPGLPESFSYEDSPFDPTSTPSRGIRLAPPSFATPKNHQWLARANGLFHTPSKPGRMQAVPGQVDSLLSSSGEEQSSVGQLDSYRGLPGCDDSPVRRTKSGAGAGALGKVMSQRFGPLRSQSPPARPLLAQPFSSMEEWRGLDGKEMELSPPADAGAGADADATAMPSDQGDMASVVIPVGIRGHDSPVD